MSFFYTSPKLYFYEVTQEFEGHITSFSSVTKYSQIILNDLIYLHSKNKYIWLWPERKEKVDEPEGHMVPGTRPATG